MKKILVLVLNAIFLLTLNLTLFAEISRKYGNLPTHFKIMPRPQQTELLSGEGIQLGKLRTCNIQGGLKRPVMGTILSQLTESVNGGSGKGTLTLKLGKTSLVPESAEGYILTIHGGNAEIVSRGEAGLFYGCQTLEQLLEDARDYGKSIPACRIIDFPMFSYRAVQMDVKHHLDHMNYYYECIDRLARYKINAVIFEFEDKLRYRKQPLIAAPQAISIDEMAALTMYAKKRHIEITPLVQGLGHATFILKHPLYADLRELQENRWAFCPLHEGTYKVLFDLYSDAMAATPGSRYLHIGGDEIGNIGICPRCKPTADEKGLLQLNLYWLKKVCDFIKSNGRIPIFWDDMPLKVAGVYEATVNDKMTETEALKVWEKNGETLEKVISDFPKDCVYMRWNYTMGRQPGNMLALDWYKKHNLKVMVATAAQSGPASLFPFDERDKGLASKGVAAIQSFLQLAAEKGINGMLCTAWDDRSPHMETLWRGLIASAEYSWSPGKRTLEECDEAFLQREFRVTMPSYNNLYRQLREAADFWAGAYNRSGNRMDIGNALLELPGIAHFLPYRPGNTESTTKTDFTTLLIDLPDLKSPGSWIRKYKDRLAIAEQIAIKYPEINETLEKLLIHSKRNRYHWEVFKVLNDLQVTAPHLLLALKHYDSVSKVQQESGRKEVLYALQEFDNAWSNLKVIYAETRFISYPPDYVPDRYYHFASQREDISWMIQQEELFHQKIREWLRINFLK